MDIDSILKGIEGWRIATAIREGLFSFPIFESIHVVGLAMVFGTILIVDLRLLGLASTNRPFQKLASEIIKWTWVGFAITLITGALMFTTNASVYYHNTYFRIKMLLLVLAGINMGYFELTTGKKASEWGGPGSTHPAGRRAAKLSLLIWISVIVFGRLIGFTTSNATAPPPPSEVNLDDVF
jgi:uncharacterized membrane protein